jgi:hypothetical protein
MGALQASTEGHIAAHIAAQFTTPADNMTPEARASPP